MKKILVVLFLLLLLSGGSAGIYFYVLLPQKAADTLVHSEPIISKNQLNLIQVRSFRVPVLHNSVAVKILVFHVVLDMQNSDGIEVAESAMNHLVDLYIRCLVAYFEINLVDDRINVNDIDTLLNQASLEVLGPQYPVRQVLLQGVYQKTNVKN